MLAILQTFWQFLNIYLILQFFQGTVLENTLIANNMFVLSKGVVPAVVVILFLMKQIVAVKYMTCAGVWLKNIRKAASPCGRCTTTARTPVKFNVKMK